MLTITLLLSLLALLITIVHAIGRAPLWPAVLLLTIIFLISSLPLR